EPTARMLSVTGPAGADTVYSPLAFVAASRAVPTTATVAPATGLPSRLPVTFPVMGRCWAARVPPNRSPAHTNRVRCTTIPSHHWWFNANDVTFPIPCPANGQPARPG